MFSGSMSITWHVFGSMFWVDPDWLRNASQPFLGPKKWRWMSGPSRLKPAVSPDRCHRTWVHFSKDGNGFWGWTCRDYSHTHTYLWRWWQYSPWIVFLCQPRNKATILPIIGKDDFLAGAFFRMSRNLLMTGLDIGFETNSLLQVC